MKYVKSCLIITMLLGFGYSQCNESNWYNYYPYMQNCDLVGADLEGANLEYADLLSANFANANLKGADLSNASLSEANLLNANLTGADLHYAGCYRTFFVGATLDNTVFGSAVLTYAYFDENEDFYDDLSYDAGATSGDLNLDGANDVLDVVILVDNILNP